MQPPAETNWPTNRTEIAPRTVVLIGASIRSAAQSAQLAGFQVVGIDQFGDLDTREACQHFWKLDEFSSNPEFLTHCKRFPVLTVGGLNSHRDLVESLERDCAAWPSTNPVAVRPPTSLWDDPWWMADLSRSCDLKFPTTLPINDRTDRRLSREGGRWLQKAHKSSGGLGVRWYGSDLTHVRSPENEKKIDEPECQPSIILDHVATSGDRDPDAPSDAVVQRWVAGRPHGATLICNGTDSRLLGVCRSLFTRRTDLPFVYRGSMGPVRLPSHVTCRLQHLGELIVAQTGWRGLLNIDFVVDPQGVAWILEINPRWSGSSELIERSILERNPTTSLFGIVVHALHGGKLESIDQESLSQSAAELFLKRIVFARSRVCFSRQQVAPIINPHDQLCDYPMDGTWIPKGDPICTLVSRVPRTHLHQPSPETKKGPMLAHRASFIRLLEQLER